LFVLYITINMNTKQTVCDKLQQMFVDCARPIYKFPVGPEAMLVNEANKYNCIILSKELHERCGNAVDSKTFVHNLPDEWNNSQNP
jgi:hypothetical protein